MRIHKKVSKAEATERAIEVLQLVGMPRPAERLRQYPHQLSGGLRQRVMIAIALACEPKLLIADEPTTALDVTIQAQILDLIDELRERLKMAVLLITHDMGVIAGRTDRVMVMYAGKIVESGAPREPVRPMRHPYSEALLDSIPKLDARRQRASVLDPGRSPRPVRRDSSGCRFAPRCRNATEQCRTRGAAAGRRRGHLVACFNPVGSATSPCATATRRRRRRGRPAGAANGSRSSPPASSSSRLTSS